MIFKSLLTLFFGIFLFAFLLFFVPLYLLSWGVSRLFGFKTSTRFFVFKNGAHESIDAEPVLLRTEQGHQILDKEPQANTDAVSNSDDHAHPTH